MMNLSYNFIGKKPILNTHFRIEEEEVDSHQMFDQNKDGIVSQDEKDVSNNYTCLVVSKCFNFI